MFYHFVRCVILKLLVTSKFTRSVNLILITFVKRFLLLIQIYVDHFVVDSEDSVTQGIDLLNPEFEIVFL